MSLPDACRCRGIPVERPLSTILSGDRPVNDNQPRTGVWRCGLPAAAGRTVQRGIGELEAGDHLVLHEGVCRWTPTRGIGIDEAASVAEVSASSDVPSRHMVRVISGWSIASYGVLALCQGSSCRGCTTGRLPDLLGDPGSRGCGRDGSYSRPTDRQALTTPIRRRWPALSGTQSQQVSSSTTPFAASPASGPPSSSAPPTAAQGN